MNLQIPKSKIEKTRTLYEVQGGGMLYAHADRGF